VSDEEVDAAAREVEFLTGPHGNADSAEDFARRVLEAAAAVRVPVPGESEAREEHPGGTLRDALALHLGGKPNGDDLSRDLWPRYQADAGSILAFAS
jgi:hypothetical protein